MHPDRATCPFNSDAAFERAGMFHDFHGPAPPPTPVCYCRADGRPGASLRRADCVPAKAAALPYMDPRIFCRYMALARARQASLRPGG